ncbi:hypothetical protein B841_09775 [Corynebacterium maris DSM 45190]|uniref:Uncharacterized protein n=1 Tax=Corynebacterium maris DSM 45190 TaxID=1224163 RepID=S5SWH9_9CORY|nr:hypothetical protein [Corynebacterium maris]AGS35427.1 hypothetical protein B841_09775 [Corynebacterium maris DSM 45190]
MQKVAAQLRHRELTQEIYNIGDEVAEYIEHLVEAVHDWDGDLAAECLAEFSEIVDDARHDARRIIGELLGLRQALTSGVRAGVLSASSSVDARIPEPELLDADGLEELHPVSSTPVAVRELADALDARTALAVQHLTELVDFTLEQTDRVARDLDAVSLPRHYARIGELVTQVTRGWLDTVVEAHPGYTRTMRGANPPEFLVERARVDAIVARVAAKKARERDFAS